MHKVINVENLTKTFILPHEKRTTLKENFLKVFQGLSYETFKALDKVNFEAEQGDFIGVIGKNGSGKSTLLKILAGIYSADSGKAYIQGKVAPFLELGIGFQPELTAKENIFINGALLGLTTSQLESKFDQIVDFAEIRPFLDLKIKNYSSGMRSRLAFAIATQAEADLYLCDEVLAVGDEQFQQKCFTVFKKWKAEGKTIVLVSHSMSLIEEFCNKALFLEQGKVIAFSEPKEVIAAYHRHLEVKTVLTAEKNKLVQDFTGSPLRIQEVKILDSQKEIKNHFATGEEIVFRIYYKAKEKVDKPVVGIAIHHESGTHITGPNTKTSDYTLEYLEGEGWIDCRLVNHNLLGGNYFLTVSCFDYSCVYPFDYLDKSFPFTIVANRANQYGLVEFNIGWELKEQL